MAWQSRPSLSTIISYCGGDTGTQTLDLSAASAALYQLSYIPMQKEYCILYIEYRRNAILLYPL